MADPNYGRGMRAFQAGQYAEAIDHFSRAQHEGFTRGTALRCIGGQMQGKLILDTPPKRERAFSMGITDPNRVYDVSELAAGDVLVAATGVTDGTLLDGIRLRRRSVETSTIVMRSWSQTVRWIRAQHAR